MAIINYYTRNDNQEQYNHEKIIYDGTAVSWLLSNIKKGQNFSVYDGSLSREKEISRDYDALKISKEVSVFILPSSGTGLDFIVATVFAVKALIPKPIALGNLNRTQQSPNNSLADRDNLARPLQRIVDLCGTDKLIVDVLSREYVRIVNDVEQRVGYYIAARNKIQIEDIKEGDTLISETRNASVGVYDPFTSPNNSAPDIQIGDPIDEPVYGVTQSADATGQTLKPDNINTTILDGGFSVTSSGEVIDDSDNVDFTDKYKIGDELSLVNLKVNEGGVIYSIGENTSEVLAVQSDKITFDITGDTSWAIISSPDTSIIESYNPKIEEAADELIGPFKMTTFKINKLLVNINALNGVYKEDKNGRSNATVSYKVNYQKLDDGGNPIGSQVTIIESITGNSNSEKGLTTEIDLGGETFVQWSLERITPLDFEFEGTIVDEIRLNSVFGLSNIPDEHFGNVTTIQTKRTNEYLATATKTPELNCIGTELVYKYLGNGVFDTNLTPNNQAMQSLIRLALDPYIGRRQESELDLDLLLSLQDECESYFGSDKSGQFNYSFDSTAISAQETFIAIAKAAFIELWREGRVLKGAVEKPQSIPSMVFTHRSKQPNSETWDRKRNTEDAKDSIEFTYTDSLQYKKETLFYPEDRSGRNPERIEMTGVKGKEQAYWHMMRLYNKNKYQEVSVDFGATSEGRFVKPQSAISVAKGTRVYTYDGDVIDSNGLLLTLSQDVSFTDGDSHSIILKRRDGSTESIMVFETSKKNVVKLLELPSEQVYTGNSALKTEFSFGNEDRLSAQMMLPQEITPTGDSYVKIKAINYSPLYYSNDKEKQEGAFSSGFDEGFK